jgi:Protein of unknown function (DUF3631)
MRFTAIAAELEGDLVKHWVAVAYDLNSLALAAGLNDRAEDCWSPLFAIADIAGGNWPDLARKAALALSADTDDSAIGSQT